VRSCQQEAVVTGETTMPKTSDESQGRTVTVFPNPSVVGFTLELRSNKTEKVEIMVYDVMGHALHHATGDETGTYRFGETFIKGMYFVKVLYKNGSKVLKVVKQ
jgi:hypothetical protein